MIDEVKAARSDRIKAFKALSESEQRFRLITETISEVFWMADVEIRRLFYVSPAYERIWGRTRHELRQNPRSFIDAIHHEDRQAAVKVLGSQNTGLPFDHEYRIVRPDGSVRWIWDRGFPVVDRDGKVRRYVGVAQDITERRSVEDDRLKVQKLESVGLLAGGIAHNFNNLLTVVTGATSLLRALVADRAEADELVGQIEQATRECKELTDQFLAFSRGGQPVKEFTTLGPLLEETVNFASRGTGMRCEFSIPPDLWAVDVDKGHMGQVFRNLAMNAANAMPQGGCLRVSAWNVPGLRGPEESALSGRRVEASFQDEGRGIKKEHLDKIFDPFFTTEQGNGLGLATSFLILKRHGGSLSVESGEGLGTTFTISLPAHQEKQLQEGPNRRERPAERFRVLVMDDEKLIRNMIGKLLAARGHEAAFAVDGEEAISLYRQSMENGTPFDVVILDLTIAGGMGGKDAIARLLEIDPNIRAIVSSGYCQDAAMSDYRKLGFSAVLGKPYTLEDLMKVLHRVMEKVHAAPLPDPVPPDAGDRRREEEVC